jgi:hypothetical protein
MGGILLYNIPRSIAANSRVPHGKNPYGTLKNADFADLLRIDLRFSAFICVPILKFSVEIAAE